MAETGIPEKLLPAIRHGVFWALPSILLLVGIERIFGPHGDRYQAGACFLGALVSIVIAVYWDKIITWVWPRYAQQRSLSYLSERDTTLSWAIRIMAERSAWGRWFAAQHLVNSKTPIDEDHLLQTAASIVRDKILDGDLEVRGRLPGKLDYEVIPRTDWRSSGFHFVKDPRTLWKMVIFPTGGAEIAPDGTIARASDPRAAARNAQINYDSFIVDAYQFEKLWPKKSALADRKRRKLLFQARWRGLNKHEIRRLC